MIAEFPKRLYRPGTTFHVWGKMMVDALTVENEAQEEQALADDWVEIRGGLGVDTFLTDEADVLLTDPAGNLITEG